MNEKEIPTVMSSGDSSDAEKEVLIEKGDKYIPLNICES